MQVAAVIGKQCSELKYRHVSKVFMYVAFFMGYVVLPACPPKVYILFFVHITASKHLMCTAKNQDNAIKENI